MKNQTKRSGNYEAGQIPGSDQHSLVLPYSQDAEEGVIACCLVEGAIALEFKGLGVSADWFHGQTTRRLWQALERLMAAAQAVDEMTVGEALHSVGDLEPIGGLGEIGRIAMRVESTQNRLHWLEIVRKHWLHRKALLSALTGLEELRSPAASVEEVRERCMEVSRQLGDLVAGAVRRSEKVVAAEAEAMMERLLSGEKVWPDGRMIGHGLAYLDDHTQILGSSSPTDRPLRQWMPTEVIVLAARPSVGKTTLAIQCAANALLRRNQCVIFDSLEMQMEEIVMRMAAVAAGVPLDDSLEFRQWCKERPENMHKVEVMRANMRLIKQLAGERFFFRGGGTTLEEILTHARWAHQRCGQVHLMVVDYLQLVDMGDGKGKPFSNRQEVVATVSRKFKLLAMELECCALVLSQFNREADEETGPKLTHLRESGAIEQDADRVYALWEPKKDANGAQIGERSSRPMKLRVLKHRRGPKDFDLSLNFSYKSKVFFGVPGAETRGRPRKGMTAEESREQLKRERLDKELNRGIAGFEETEQVSLDGLPSEAGPSWDD
jgi:replicative DNA helicase